ncbi:protein phosphatase methylesterase 1 [Kwoniella heveanensis CBS 569]|nr:protein phosphatase methylesterase 1 [Kwoniella heveanensis CBS 569]
MSDVFRKAMTNKLPRLPPTRAPWADEPEREVAETEDLEDEEGDSLADLGAMLPPPTKYGGTDLSPLSASSFFSQALEVSPPSSPCTFRVYLTPPTSTPSSQQRPGGSDSGGSGSSKNGTYLVCHHGGGASGLSFAALAREVKSKSDGEMGVLAFDCRGHGKTQTEGSLAVERDLSLPTLLSDFLGLVEHMFPDPKAAPSLVLLGHSMGAAPILSAAPILQSKGYTVPGVVVLDVVEGTAVEALPLMKGIIAQRPSSFRSVVDAIHWHLSSHTIRDTDAARVSVPSLLVPAPDPGPSSALDSQHHLGPKGKQVWRTDLLATEPYWEDWYRGLSSRFLAAKCARLLVLAGQERLDKELMVGQMQGKFQLEVMQDTGHYLHEDNPSSLASTLVQFWRRNTRVLVLPPKIGQTGVSGLKNSAPAVVRRVGEE